MRISDEQRAPASADDAPSAPATVENKFYRITINQESGDPKSIFDKELNRELVDQQSPYRFGEYLYVTGGDGDTQMINPFPALSPGKLTVHSAINGKLLSVEHTPWGQSIRLASTNVHTPAIETELLLFNDQKKLEFRYRVHKEATTDKEAVYFAFPTAAKIPTFRFAAQQGSVDPAQDLMKGGSLEWFSIQQWMSVGEPGLSVGIVPLDAPLASFGDINRGQSWDYRPPPGDCRQTHPEPVAVHPNSHSFS